MNEDQVLWRKHTLLRNEKWRTAYKETGVGKYKTSIYSAYIGGNAEYDKLQAHVVVTENKHDGVLCYIGFHTHTFHKIKRHAYEWGMAGDVLSEPLHNKSGHVDGVIFYDRELEDTKAWHDISERSPHPEVGLYGERTYLWWQYKETDTAFTSHRHDFVRYDMHIVLTWLGDCLRKFDEAYDEQCIEDRVKRNNISLLHIRRLKACAEEINRICAEHIDIYDTNNNLVA